MEKTDFKARLENLEQAREKLKAKFIGLDEVIDKIIHLVTPWYTMARLQERPSIICLWGMSGTGKTALVSELMKYLGEGEKTYRLEMGRESSYEIHNTLEDIYADRNSAPMALILDEFQHARTKDEEGKEKNPGPLRAIWDLLDNGKVQYRPFHGQNYVLLDLLKQLHFLVRNGVKVQNGVVTENADLYKSRMEGLGRKPSIKLKEINQVEEENPLVFIPDNYVDDIQEQLSPEFASYFDVADHLLTLDEKESLDIVYRAVRKSFDPRTIDCSKSVIFVIGNLDEAYEMHNDTSSDSSASLLRKHSEQIGISKVKKALLARFRAEQVARLGNNHIIYPALGEKEFLELITMQLEISAQKIEGLCGLKSEFHSSVHQFILREGVTPTQGARPLFSTLANTVDVVIPFLMVQANELVLSPEIPLVWKVENERLLVSYWGREVYSNELFSLLHKKRKPKKDDKQALVAVHESGHALLHYLLFSEAPQLIVSQGTDEDSAGFVQRDLSTRMLSRKSVVSELAILLAGLEAEALVFGEENITMGATNDLHCASKLALKAVLRSGFGKQLTSHADGEPFKDSNFPSNPDLHQQTSALIAEAREKAAKTLRDHYGPLRQLALYLADHSQMNKEEFEAFVEAQGLKPLEERFGYRERLLNGKDLILSSVTNEPTLNPNGFERVN